MPSNDRRPDLSDLKLDPSARAGSAPGGPRRWLWVGGGAAVALVALGLMCGRSGPAEVEVAEARAFRAGEREAVLQASGYVTPRRKATVAAKVTGQVREVLVDEGMRVEEGQVLARLDDSEAKAYYAAALGDRDSARAAVPDLEAQSAEAAQTLQRYEALAREGVLDTQTLDRQRAQADALRARLKAAREQAKAAEGRLAAAQQALDNCTVRAPFAGIAVSKDAQPGEMVSPISAGGGFTRTGIATVVDMASLEVEVDVSEASIARVTPGMAVEAALDAYPDWKIPAHVRTVIPSADRQKATVKVRITFDALDPKILPDMGVKVAFLAEPAPAGPGDAAVRCLVPKEAVREESGAQVAYVLKEGKLSRRALTLGAPRGAQAAVASGVEAGERVVVSGPARLRDGQKAKEKAP
jgi:RND family efflux transporter MFP subunit